MTKNNHMPKKFEELSDYNARKSKGIKHEGKYIIKMVKLQKEFNEWIKLKNAEM